MTLPPKNGQVDLLLTVRVEPSERVPWDVRVRLFYKDLARRGIRVLSHQLLRSSEAKAASSPPDAADAKPDNARATAAAKPNGGGNAPADRSNPP